MIHLTLTETETTSVQRVVIVIVCVAVAVAVIIRYLVVAVVIAVVVILEVCVAYCAVAVVVVIVSAVVFRLALQLFKHERVRVIPKSLRVHLHIILLCAQGVRIGKEKRRCFFFWFVDSLFFILCVLLPLFDVLF